MKLLQLLAGMAFHNLVYYFMGMLSESGYTILFLEIFAFIMTLIIMSGHNNNVWNSGSSSGFDFDDFDGFDD